MSSNPRLLDDFRAWVRHNPGVEKERAIVFLDEERPRFPAECNLCNGPITNGQFARASAVINGMGEMWHVACRRPAASLSSRTRRRLGMDENGMMRWVEIITPFERWFRKILPDMEAS